MNGHAMTIATIDVETSFVNGNGTATHQPPQGSVLSAHNIDYTVMVSDKCCKTKPKQVLFNVTGIFKQGMTAILGPTGSGKSSFLDVLAGRKEPEGVSGQILLNGKAVPKNFKCMVGYVVQDDVVMGTLSVRENFAFSAALRLPKSVTASERKEKINNVIKELGLERCADTKVGNEFIRGVSGGERKRCNIGMELIISPPVLFLDEPTTGLDANTANTVLLFLKRLSKHGRTIIFSIHQPRYSIYRLFDSLVLLSQGHTVYHGPAREALEFFNSQGYICQEHNNPPDFFLDVINGDPTTFGANAISIDKEIETDFETTQSQHDKLVEGFKSSRWNRNLLEEAKSIYSVFEATRGIKGEQHQAIDYATAFFTQVAVVAKRALVNLIRNPQTSILTVSTSIIFAIIIGAIFWQLGEDPDSAFKDRGGVIFFLIMNQLFFNMSAVEVFINERKIFMHENVSGFYRVSVYFLVKVLFDIIPLRLVPVSILSCVVYFAVGLNPGADHFFLFFFCLFCTTLAAASLCFLLSSLVRVFSVASLLLALCYVLMMLLGGFLINFDSVGPWLNWAQYLSLFKYALSILYINEFKGRNFCNGNGTVCKTGEWFLGTQNMKYADDWDLWQNYLALLLYAFILFSLAYIRLRTMKKTT